ncbi:MAG: alpha/beta fold hydrolase [Candidatus Eisenbacteria bacterium]|nr:alpha/beta fold hydrolase [Candidatus Eisenbacteria bacterium]
MTRQFRTIVALVALTFVFTIGRPAQALRPARAYRATPGDYGIVHEPVTFLTSDSLRLVGWFYPQQDTAGIANDLVGRVIPVPERLRRASPPFVTSGQAPVVVICDGDGGNMADLIFYAYQFFTRGYHVFTFDWRGFGGSAHWPMDRDQLCCTEFLLDYDAAIRYIMTRPDAAKDKVALMGFSTGAYLSFAMLVEHDEIAAFAGRALLTSFDDILPILREVAPQRSFHAPPDYPSSLLPINAAPRVGVPAFLVVGERDARTPPWMSRRILGLLKGPKELWIVPGAGHGGASAPEFTDYPTFFERVAAFFDANLEAE